MSTKKDRILAENGANLEESSGPAESIASGRPSSSPAARPARHAGVERSRESAKIDLDRIMPDSDQPRTEFDAESLKQLAESLRTKGQLQPIRVRWHEAEGKYMVIMGERRYRAATIAGLASLDCVIEDRKLSPAELLELQVVENAEREDLKPVEKARAIKRMIDEFGYTTTQVGERLNMSQPAVSKSLALLDLAPEVQADVDSGAISKQAGYQISRASTPEAQTAVAAKVKAENLTEAQAAEEVRAVDPRPRRVVAGKGRGASARKLKVKTELFWSDSGHRIKVECKKGIQEPVLRDILLRKAESLATAS